MQLTPRYGSNPVIVLADDGSDIVTPTLRQRRRLADVLDALDDDHWTHASRCDEWSARDVVDHLDTTNRFWTASIEAGLRNEPTELLATFDPVRSPAGLVAARRDHAAAEVLAAYRSSTEDLATVLGSLDDHDLEVPAEAPPGHISIRAVLHHALWDAWTHERDILLPLGIPPAEEPDEIASCLRYAAGLGPALAITRGRTRRGSLAIDVRQPDVAVVAEVGDRVVVRLGRTDGDADVRLTGDAVDVLEALSQRRPLDQAVPEGSSWLLDGLAEQFDAA